MADLSMIKGNPYLGTLAVGGGAATLIGLLLIVSYDPGLFDTGIDGQVILGSSLVSLGLFLLIGWLVAGAVIWRPEPKPEAKHAPTITAETRTIAEKAYKADWYPDARQPGKQRWYDGKQWTDVTRDAQ